MSAQQHTASEREHNGIIAEALLSLIVEPHFPEREDGVDASALTVATVSQICERMNVPVSEVLEYYVTELKRRGFDAGTLAR